MTTTVVNLRKEKYDVYIGRPGKGMRDCPFGNPFVIGKDGNRREVIEKYREWVVTQPQIMRLLPDLRGKRLGCFCDTSKQGCHGLVLIELLERFTDKELRSWN